MKITKENITLEGDIRTISANNEVIIFNLEDKAQRKTYFRLLDVNELKEVAGEIKDRLKWTLQVPKRYEIIPKIRITDD